MGIATAFRLIALALAALCSTPVYCASPAPENPYGDIVLPAPDVRGTEKQPLIVESLPDQYQSVHAGNERLMMQATVGLAIVTAILTIFTFLLWRANKTLIEQAARVSASQAMDTRDALTEATRSADAIARVADATTNNAMLMQTIMQKQMRAYVSVDTGVALHQDRRLRFGSKPVLNNSGFTPAKNVRYRVRAAIFDRPVSSLFEFPDDGELSDHDATLSPRQTFTLNAAVNERFPEAEVAEIMLAETKRLFAWGTVTYDDVFGGHWETKFCHHFVWFRADETQEWRYEGFYHTVHNSTT